MSIKCPSPDLNSLEVNVCFSLGHTHLYISEELHGSNLTQGTLITVNLVHNVQSIKNALSFNILNTTVDLFQGRRASVRWFPDTTSSIVRESKNTLVRRETWTSTCGQRNTAFSLLSRLSALCSTIVFVIEPCKTSESREVETRWVKQSSESTLCSCVFISSNV